MKLKENEDKILEFKMRCSKAFEELFKDDPPSFITLVYDEGEATTFGYGCPACAIEAMTKYADTQRPDTPHTNKEVVN